MVIVWQTLQERSEASVDLTRDDSRVTDVRAVTPDGTIEVRAALVLGTDGRTSVVRERAGLDVMNIGAPFDVLWMRITKHAQDDDETFGIIDHGRFLVMIDRHDYYQCGFVIAKGSLAAVHGRGLQHFRDEIASMKPELRGRLAHRVRAARGRPGAAGRDVLPVQGQAV